jgi:NAD(P)H-flavin reductase
MKMPNFLSTLINESANVMKPGSLTSLKQAANVIPLPKHPKVMLKASWAPSEPALSPKRGLHKATLIKTTTLVPEIPGKICPVQTFTFRLDGYPSMNVAEHVRLDCGDTMKLYLQEKDGCNWTFKSYSPTDTSRPGEIDITVKLYPDGQNAKMLQALQVGQDHIYMAGPWRRKQRLPTSHAYLIAFGIGITEIYPVAKQLVEDGIPTTILYANRYREDVCFRPELDQMAKQNPDLFQVKYMYSRQTDLSSANEFSGRLDSAKILQQVLGLDKNIEASGIVPRFLTIGSKPMMRQAWNCLHGLGYPRDEYELLQ